MNTKTVPIVQRSISRPIWHEVIDNRDREMTRDERRARRRQMLDWCWENAGTDGIFWRSPQHPGKQIWRFRNAGTAMMFNLTWL